MSNSSDKIIYEDNLPLYSDERAIIGYAYNDGFLDEFEAKYLLKHPKEAREYIGRGEALAN